MPAGATPQRQERPERSGRAPARRGRKRVSAALWPLLEPGRGRRRRTSHRRNARSAAKRATLTSRPAARISPTGAIADPQIELEFRAARRPPSPASALRGRGRVGADDREARAVAAEDEGKRSPSERVGDRGDRPGADHVDGLVAALRDRFGRADDVGEADDPVVRQRAISFPPYRVGEIVRRREGSRRSRCRRCHRAPAFASKLAQRRTRGKSVGAKRLDQRPGPAPSVTSRPARSPGERTPWPPRRPPAARARERYWRRWRSTACSRSRAGSWRRCRGAAKRRTASRRHEKVDRLLALEMAALHQHGARPEREQRRALPRHVGFASRDRLARAAPPPRRDWASGSRQAAGALADRLDEARAAQRVAGGGDHDRIVDDEGPHPARPRPPSPARGAAKGVEGRSRCGEGRGRSRVSPPRRRRSPRSPACRS